jgi:hypothetical protein
MRRRPMLKMSRLLKWESLTVLAVASMLVATPRASAETLPTVTYTVNGIAGTNGWYRGSAGGDYVQVIWTVKDPDGLVKQGCISPTAVPGPTTGARATCTLTFIDDRPPVSFPTTLLKIDRDPPTAVSANFARAPDFNGWYNHPVAATWQGRDATSGISSCSAVAYGGPDQGGAAISGGCTDNAGNSAAAPLSINYDATAPVLQKLTVEGRSASDLVLWTSSSPSDTAVVQRWPRGGKEQPVVFRGAGGSFMDRKVAPGLEYTYAVQTFDQAGNASKRLVVAGLPKVLTLQKLPYVPRVSEQPILRWPAVRGARYYNVQLYRGSKRVFAAWPAKNHLGLPAKWKWAGKWRQLGPGRYRWYVWAGIGRRSFAHYRTVGNAQFIVPR